MTTFTSNLFGVAQAILLTVSAKARMVGKRPMQRVAILNRLDADLAALQARM